MLDFIRQYLIPPPISRQRKKLALVVAAFIDFIQMFLWPFFFQGAASPFDLTSDIIAAVSLILICGFKWQFILGFVFETIPVLSLCPTWLAVALLIPVKADEPALINDVKPYIVALPPALPENEKPQMNAMHADRK